MNPLVEDSFGAGRDVRISFLRLALDPQMAERRLAECLAARPDCRAMELEAIRVLRYKPGRRALIEYSIRTGDGHLTTLLGKVRAKGADWKTYRLTKALYTSGFGESSGDGVRVPEPLGIIPELGMWLQEKVQAESTWKLLSGSRGFEVAARVAAAVHKLHQAPRAGSRRHTIDKECEILRRCLTSVCRMKQGWSRRILRILESCEKEAGRVREQVESGIHRDFYPDQILVNGFDLYLIDLDLYSIGHPALDLGNFLAHMAEYALRTFSDAEALRLQQDTLMESYLERAGSNLRPAIEVYTFFSLARHIYISTLFPERQAFTEPLLELCERQIG